MVIDLELPKLKVFAGIGSQSTPLEICVEITKLAKKMAEKGWILRSGGADGADAAFEAGYVQYPLAKEIYLPWKGFNNNPSPLYKITNEAIELAKKYHPAWNNVIRKGEGSIKLLARNGYQILGHDLKSPCDLVICWTKNGKDVGGTSQAIRIAKDKGIKVINLADIKTQ